MRQGIEERLKRLTTASSHEEGARRTDQIATGLEAAVILIEHMDESEPGPELAAKFAEAGLTGTVEELQRGALDAVSQKAAMERSIADSLARTGAEIRRAAPPPPGPPPPDLAHPETRGGLGPLTR